MVKTVMEKIQDFMKGLTVKERADAYAIFTAMRGPDVSNYTLKSTYTETIRGLVFKGITTSCPGNYSTIEVSIKQFKELYHQMIKASGAEHHFLNHAYLALSAIYGKEVCISCNGTGKSSSYITSGKCYHCGGVGLLKKE